MPPSGPQQVPYQPPAPGQYPYPDPYPAPYGFGYLSANPPGISGLAIGALVTGLVGLGPIAVGLGISALPQTTDEPVVDIGELGQGECFDETDDDFEVIARSCDTSHDGEVFATLVLAPRPYPGDRAVRDEAEEACDRQFKEYVGVDVHASELESDYVYPSRDMWENGERDVMCLAYGPDGETLDRTVKDSKR